MGRFVTNIVEVDNCEPIAVHLNIFGVLQPTTPKDRDLYIGTIVYFPYIIYDTKICCILICSLIQGLNTNTTVLGHGLLVLGGSIE